MSRTGQFRQYAEERDPPRPRVGTLEVLTACPGERVSPHQLGHRRFAWRVWDPERGSPMCP